MVARYGTPSLHRRQTEAKYTTDYDSDYPGMGVRLCLALAAPFTPPLSLLLLVIVASSPVRFPDSPDEHQIRRVICESTTAESSLRAPYSPYYPAGNYEAQIREGCVLSQVNIANFFPRRRPTHHSDVLSCSFNATEPSTQLPRRPSQF